MLTSKSRFLVRNRRLLSVAELASMSKVRKSSSDAEKSFPLENKEKRQLKSWRLQVPVNDPAYYSKLKVFEVSGQPKTDFIATMNKDWDVSIGGFQKWWKHLKLEYEITEQRFIKERHATLGSNLAAAHFIVHRGGKVRFTRSKEWVTKDKDDKYELPGTYQPNYVVEAIDASYVRLHYEGLVNLCHLNELKWLSFKGCPFIDDWCLDKISSQFPKLEHLDLSDCENVTERGLEALYRIHSLRTLIVTNHDKSAAFELTCMMLEDCVPGLFCEIRSKTEPVPEQ